MRDENIKPNGSTGQQDKRVADEHRESEPITVGGVRVESAEPGGGDGARRNSGGGNAGTRKQGWPAEARQKGADVIKARWDKKKAEGWVPAREQRKRAEQPGNPAPQKKAVHLIGDEKALSAGIYSVHELAAILLKDPDWELDEAESLKLAQALIKLQTIYPAIDVPLKTLVWFQLVIACGQVYGPRIIAKVKKAKPAPVAAPAPVQYMQR
jgi:hypothetical protein